MAADIRPVGPGKLAIVGQGLSNLGDELLKQKFLEQNLNQQSQLETEKALKLAAIQNPMGYLIAKMMGLVQGGPESAQAAGGSSPIDPAVLLGAGPIDSAKNIGEVPTEDEIRRNVGLIEPSALTPNPEAFTSQARGQIMTPAGTPSADYTPQPNAIDRPPIQQLLAARQAKIDSFLNGMKQSEQTKLDVQNNPANAQAAGQAASIKDIAETPGATTLYQGRGQGYTIGRQLALGSPEGLAATKASNEAAGEGREAGSQRVLLSPGVVKGEANKAGQIAGAEETARQNVLLSPDVMSRQLNLFKNRLILESAAANDREAANRANVATEAATRGVSALTALQGAWQQFKKSNPDILATKLDKLTGLQGPQERQLDNLSQAVASQLGVAIGIDPKDAASFVPNSRTLLNGTGEAQLANIGAMLTTAPIIQRDTAGMGYAQKLQVSQQISKLYQAALSSGTMKFEDPITHEMVTLNGQ